MRRAVFVSGLGGAVAVASCGRQVTPSPLGNGTPSGYMSVTFQVQSAFNWGTNSYLIVFNTGNPSSTNTVTPVAAAVQNGFAGYSLGIAVSGTSGSITAQAYSYYRPNGPSQNPYLYPIVTTAPQLRLNSNSNGQGNAFQVIFDRIIAAFNVTSGSPTPSPTGSPVVSPSPTVVPSGGVSVTQWWTFNFFTVSGSLQNSEAAQSATVLDSLGSQGATDATYTSQVLNVDKYFDYTVYTNTGTHPSTSDAITGGILINSP